MKTHINITKSRSGHRTLTIRQSGEWQRADGTTYQDTKIVYRAVKLDSVQQANMLAAAFKTGSNPAFIEQFRA